MRNVERSDIVDLATYERERGAVRERVMAIKGPRRIRLGEHLTFLFENFETMRYQVQEMLRAEQRAGEDDIAHELSTYNELLGDSGQLACTLLIEEDDKARRDLLLHQWRGLPEHLYAELADGTRIHAAFDPRQVGDERLSAVQYLKFDCRGETPIALGCDMPGVELHQELSAAQREALTEDLAS